MQVLAAFATIAIVGGIYCSIAFATSGGFAMFAV
jgi:hypothetical protein